MIHGYVILCITTNKKVTEMKTPEVMAGGKGSVKIPRKSGSIKGMKNKRSRKQRVQKEKAQREAIILQNKREEREDSFQETYREYIEESKS